MDEKLTNVPSRNIMHYGGNRFKIEHINRKNVRSYKKRDSMRSFVGKENQTKRTFLQDKDLFQITLSCLPPNRYTVKRVGKASGKFEEGYLKVHDVLSLQGYRLFCSSSKQYDHAI